MKTLPDACSLASRRAVVDEGRVTGDGDAPQRRAREGGGVAGDGLVVAVAVEGERAPAGVAGRVAAAAPEQAEAARDPVISTGTPCWRSWVIWAFLWAPATKRTTTSTARATRTRPRSTRPTRRASAPVPTPAPRRALTGSAGPSAVPSRLRGLWAVRDRSTIGVVAGRAVGRPCLGRLCSRAGNTAVTMRKRPTCILWAAGRTPAVALADPVSGDASSMASGEEPRTYRPYERSTRRARRCTLGSVSQLAEYGRQHLAAGGRHVRRPDEPARSGGALRVDRPEEVGGERAGHDVRRLLARPHRLGALVLQDGLRLHLARGRGAQRGADPAHRTWAG